MTGTRERIVQPPGEPRTLWRSTLQTGSRLLQGHAPLNGFDIHVCGSHYGLGEPGHALPMGEAALKWSFSRDGEVDPRLKADLNAALGVDEMAQREARRDLAALAHPQHGVAAMRDAFPAADGRPEGVRDASEPG